MPKQAEPDGGFPSWDDVRRAVSDPKRTDAEAREVLGVYIRAYAKDGISKSGKDPDGKTWDSVDGVGWSLAMYSVWKDRPLCVRELRQCGAFLGAREDNGTGRSPLQLAESEGKYMCAAVLKCSDKKHKKAYEADTPPDARKALLAPDFDTKGGW